jgi:biopolymer transport protein ExbD
MRHRKHYASKDDDAEINMTPMLDIVFIMLIFFIVTTSFVRESGISVNRPRAATAEQKKQKNVIIGIKPDGEVWIAKRAVDIRAVRASVERISSENPVDAVIVQADRETPTGILVRVMDQVRLAGIENISIAAETEAH